jgi:ribokinase
MAAAQMANSRGMRVILNTAPAAPLPPELLRLVDYLIPNQHELALLAGTPEIAAGARTLLQAGAKNVIVTLGGEGVYYAGEQGIFRCPAFSVPVVDTTAAGDAFMGGFACALAAGESLNEAVRWGAAAGALAVTRAGAQSSLPDRAQVQALLAG